MIKRLNLNLCRCSEASFHEWGGSAKNDTREAPIKDPTTGKVADAPLVGEGAGAEISSAAKAALMEAATTRTAQEIFFNSMMQNARVMLAASTCLGDEERVLIRFALCRSEWFQMVVNAYL
ncbi:hypothetical protein POTOM_024856 [Populus tomentosa]|uniref:Uncharacterized protein n=1 Tax=Populus tomentosa TaxID=118781 RepID=A0A8X7ZD07_POPTO|nr:hypothetical protein POTOM_024856 [Populus tomentosa]